MVADSQLSLAIGKNGQNVRLAAKLTGWKIDIISGSEYEKEKIEREKEIKAALAQEADAQQNQSVSEIVVASENSEPVQGAAEHSEDVSAQFSGEGSDNNIEEIPS